MRSASPGVANDSTPYHRPVAMSELRAVLDIPTAEAMAGRRSFERGVGYVADGRVGDVSASNDAIEAVVLGTEPYVVRLWAAEGRLMNSCTCPMGDAGTFCKHCVALALAWIEPEAEHVFAARRTGRASSASAVLRPDAWWDEPLGTVDPDADDPIRAYLTDLDHDQLVELIQDEMSRDDALRTRIELRADTAATGSLRHLRRALDRATAVAGFLDYAEVPTWAAGVEDVADAIERAIGQGQAGAVIGLAERGLQRVGAAIEKSDDSDGYHAELLRRFEQIHLAACRAAGPDPVDLAQDLFCKELVSEWDEFSGAAERYADVLGKDGLAEYRRLAEAQWSEVPARGPGADPDRLPPRQSHRDFTLTRMMESLARAQGDVDGLIEIMSRDRSSAYRFLELAQVCRGAGRLDEALEWAERGVEAFRVRTDRRLVEFLTRAYLEHERGDDAVALAWRAFEERPDLESYQVLKQTSESIGAWAAWRPRVLERVRSAYRDPVAAGTTLVTIHEREAEHDAAWNAAHELGCERVVLSRLAKRTEDTHPEEAMAAFKAEVTEVLRQADRRSYTTAIGLLRRIERISVALGRQGEFRAYAAAVREDNKRRPAFCSMFDAARFP